VGLGPYSAGDAGRFGRKREALELTSLVVSTRLVVAYGPASVGKTSLIHAGVLPRLEADDGVQTLPVARLPRASWRSLDPSFDDNPFTTALLSTWSPDMTPAARRTVTLSEVLRSMPVEHDRYDDPRILVAVVDQADEAFVDSAQTTAHRAAFEGISFGTRLQDAREVWVFGPSAIDLLTAGNTTHLRNQVLSRAEGIVRVVVLDPGKPDAIELTARQLDDGTDYPAAGIARALELAVDRLETMATWKLPGTFEYRFAPFNRGVSLVAINPYGKGGLLIVELHGLHNESNASRMHIEITRSGSEHWFVYWRHQFEYLWDNSRQP
jgi:hypothetical protein